MDNDGGQAGVDGNRNDFQNHGGGHELQLGVTDRAAQSGAVGAEIEVLSVPDDPRLLALIDAWPTLSDDARDAAARLAGISLDDADNQNHSMAPAGEAVPR